MKKINQALADEAYTDEYPKANGKPSAVLAQEAYELAKGKLGLFSGSRTGQREPDLNLYSIALGRVKAMLTVMKERQDLAIGELAKGIEIKEEAYKDLSPLKRDARVDPDRKWRGAGMVFDAYKPSDYRAAAKLQVIQNKMEKIVQNDYDRAFAETKAECSGLTPEEIGQKMRDLYSSARQANYERYGYVHDMIGWEKGQWEATTQASSLHTKTVRPKMPRDTFSGSKKAGGAEGAEGAEGFAAMARIAGPQDKIQRILDGNDGVGDDYHTLGEAPEATGWERNPGGFGRG